MIRIASYIKFSQEEHNRQFTDNVQSITPDALPVPPQGESSLWNANADDNKDTPSIYMTGNGNFPTWQQKYITQLSDDLLKNSRLAQSPLGTLEKIQSVLPRLLKAFALRLDQFDSTQMHQKIMTFIRSFRK